MSGSRRGAGLDRAARLLALLAGFCLVAMMAVTVVDVVGRYVFNAPIFGAQDLSQLLLVLVVFGAMAYCGRTDGHVAVDLFVGLFGPRLMRWIDVGVALASAGILFVLAWRAYENAKLAELFGSASNLLQIPLAPFHLVVGFGAALYGVVMLLKAWDVAVHGPAEDGV